MKILKQFIRFLYASIVDDPWLPKGNVSMWLSIPDWTFEHFQRGQGKHMSHLLDKKWQLVLHFNTKRGWKEIDVIPK